MLMDEDGNNQANTNPNVAPIQPVPDLSPVETPHTNTKRWLGVGIAIMVVIVVLVGGVWMFLRVRSRHTAVEPTNALTNTSAAELSGAASTKAAKATYPIVSTGQTKCYNNTSVLTCSVGQAFSGQDAGHIQNSASYTDNGDGTITDTITGLVWQKDPGSKVSYDQAISGAARLQLAGKSDWRVPTIKELYSLMDFQGTDPSGPATSTANLTPFINTKYFVFQYGNPSVGDRIIDSQWVTSTNYVSTVMNGQACFFGVNFADGRIKCYPKVNKTYYVRYVRGGNTYGKNAFVDNGNQTITDTATNLSWTKDDSGKGLLWADALKYCQDLSLAGRSDWRLPNAKELQSLVDYSRSPDTTNSAAIDPMFHASSITNEAGKKDYPFYWSSTTHVTASGSGANAVYVAFGRALGNMPQFGGWIDVHGAGAQRSDPKAGVPADQKNGHGPQGDAVRSYNYARCVTNKG